MIARPALRLKTDVRESVTILDQPLGALGCRKALTSILFERCDFEPNQCCKTFSMELDIQAFSMELDIQNEGTNMKSKLIALASAAMIAFTAGCGPHKNATRCCGGWWGAPAVVGRLILVA